MTTQGSAQVGGIDFQLIPRGARIGIVRDATTGLPIAGVSIDVWDNSGAHAQTVTSGADGSFFVSPTYVFSITGYRLSTDNHLGYLDQVYGNHPCATGTSVFRGTCSLDGGDVIDFFPSDFATPPLDIRLTNQVLFYDSFD